MNDTFQTDTEKTKNPKAVQRQIQGGRVNYDLEVAIQNPIGFMEHSGVEELPVHATLMIQPSKLPIACPRLKVEYLEGRANLTRDTRDISTGWAVW
ncbi:hypothetical protein RUM43_005644 [Polyplax serrata]|uniref:Uncharacterized protein n=1 Tax=Polyplax serrata TaxID=468196 RepID=A0AAN8S4X1_POLSC